MISDFSKIFESAVKKQLVDYLTEFNLLNNQQFAYMETVPPNLRFTVRLKFGHKILKITKLRLYVKLIFLNVLIVFHMIF